MQTLDDAHVNKKAATKNTSWLPFFARNQKT